MRWRDVELIVFDLDGVLVDSREPIARCMNHALRALDLAPEPEERLQRFIGASLHEVFSMLLAARGADPALAGACIARYRERYTRVSVAEARSFPGVVEAVRALGRERRLAVATSKPLAFAGPILEALGLASAFAHVAGPPLADTHLEDKAGTLARALAALGAPAEGAGPPAAAAMVGDRHFDVRAGRRLGLATVGVTWGIGDAEELLGAGADALVHDAGELVALFRGG